MVTRAQAEQVIELVTQQLKQVAETEDPTALYEATVQSVLDTLNEVI